MYVPNEKKIIFFSRECIAGWAEDKNVKISSYPLALESSPRSSDYCKILISDSVHSKNYIDSKTFTVT